MRRNLSSRALSPWSVVAAVGIACLTASNAPAQTVHLIASPVTKAVTLPNGNVVAVPMWGYALDANDDGVLDPGESVTVPGPRIVVPVGATSLTVRLTNLLPEATSLVVPGLPFAGAPARNADGRARSMTTETPAGQTLTYAFAVPRPGTFLYQSGSHSAVQVQMGLYGALTKDESAAAGVTLAAAYAGVPYSSDVVLVYSEIDQALHEAVTNGTYGTVSGPTSTLDYRPSLFLINGASYTNASMASLPAGTAGQATLLRLLNAGLRTHVPQIDNGTLTIVAEDGNKLPFGKNQAGVLLSAGKTHDVLWTPTASGTFSIYDRTLGLNAPGQGEAGMLVQLSVGAAPGDPTSALSAANHAYPGTEDVPVIGATGALLAGATGGATTAALATSAHAGFVSVGADGSFSYTPAPDFFGVDAFTYTVSDGTNTSAPALVTLTLAAVPDAPTANTQAIGVDAGANVSVTLTGQDADGDALQYYVTGVPPAHGTLSFIDPVSRVETPLQSPADYYPNATRKAIPGGLIIYTANSAYAGPDAFNFVAFDGGLASTATPVGVAVQAVETAVTAGLTQPLALTVKGNDGTSIGTYRWTLEEDLTYRVVPGVADPNTLAVRFHASYMPVVSAGTEADTPMVDPAKRYFISVLPTVNNYSNGGAGVEAGPGAKSATVTVSKLPLPTARIRVHVYQDNSPLNGMWDADEVGLAGFQVTIDDAGGTYGMPGGHQSTDAFGNKLGTTYQPCPTAAPCAHQANQLGDGFVITDAAGIAVIENLPMGKYTVKVRAPGGQRWIQTETIEGTPGIDAWVKPNEPQFFTEFGPPGPHVEVGFTRAVTGAGLLGVGAGPFSTVSGRVTNLRMSRVPAVAQFSGAPFTHTRAWVALNSGATGGNLLYTQPTNPDGTFSISGVPSGSYQLVVFDSALDLIIGSSVVNVVAPTPTLLGDVATFSWFTGLYSFVFDDKNRDGIHQANEPGIPDQALNIRFRDGSIYQSYSTDDSGFKAFNEVFPFFAWMVAEVDYTRFHSTGLTVVVDNGGDATAACASNDWRTAAGMPTDLVPCNVLSPQPQPDNGGAPFRTESGAATPFLLLEGFQGFIGQSTAMLWGKAPYEPVGSYVEDVNVAPFDDFPGPGDTDANNDGAFNTDRSNGGIAGIVHYTITRAENDPRWATAENWEPGVSDVTIQLWDASRTHLLNEAATDNFNNSLPEGCHWDQPFSYLGNTISANKGCFDGLRVFNQARPALFDGGYAFSTVLEASPGRRLPGQIGPYSTNIRECENAADTDCRDTQRPIAAGKYVVKMIAPPGYKVQKEEDKNVDFGDQYVPQQFWISGQDLADAADPPTALTSLAADVTTLAQTTISLASGGGRNVHPNDVINVGDEVMRVTAAVGDVLSVLRAQAQSVALTHAAGTEVFSHDGQPAPTATDNALIAPFCVGTLHEVPDELSLFPGVTGAFGGEKRPLCDAKLVTLREGQQVAPDFHLLTDAPKAGQIYGMVLDDTTNEFDPNAPTFGEKYGVPFLGVAIRDWQGREVTRTYTDQYGFYNALVPSTYTIQVPQPSGVAPSILQACINSPTMPGPNGTVVPDPQFQKQYSHFCYPLQYLPGKTTYLDTPVLPTGAFTGNGTLPVDAELPNKTPVIASATGPNPADSSFDATDPYGPYIVDRGATDAAARTIRIRSAAALTGDGLTEVPNPAFDGAGGLFPKLVKRDYGFGTGGTVRLDGQVVPVSNWTNTEITAVVPSGFRTGQLSVERGDQVCTVNATPLSTLAVAAGAGDTSVTVAIGTGNLFTAVPEIQIDSEVMLVNGGNRSTLGAAMTTGTTGINATLRVAQGDGAVFVAPENVRVQNEVIRLLSKRTTNLTTTLTTAQLLGFSNMIVTAGTGFTGASKAFDTNDYVLIDSEVVRIAGAGVLVSGTNSYTVQRAQLGTTIAAHTAPKVVTANDRFNVTRGFNATTVAAHANGTAVVGDRLFVTRAAEGSTAAAHASGATVSSYARNCSTSDSVKSILGITLSVATPQMHTARPPTRVGPGESIQTAIDTATAGQLILLKPGTYEEMVVMTKPVRLQGAGALSTAINVVTTPAERIQAWLDKVGNLLLSAPLYLLPNQPAMTPAPFLPGDVTAVLGDEGPGVMVLSKNQATTPLTGWCLSSNLLQPGTNFVSPANEAYCLHNENYPAGALSGAVWRPNARIDGLSLIGASNAPGVLVNGYAHNLDIANNKIFTNSGTYAGGIMVGHVGAAAPFNGEDAHNDNIVIHNNMVTQNAGNDAAGGGGIVLGTGSNNYAVKNNFVAANLAAGNGGGISHIGASGTWLNGAVAGGTNTIDGNTILFNESFSQGVGTNGGGLFIGGTPAAAGALTPGSGNVLVSNNLILGNAASGGDGGGVALLGVNGQDIARFGGLLQGLRFRVNLHNNVIANNVAGLAGAGVALSDAAYVDITHDTIADNDSTGTAGAAFTAGPLTSVPQPAGVAARGFTPLLAAALPGSPTANVSLANSIVWHNRTFYFGPCTPSAPGARCGIVPVGPTPGTTQYAEIQITARPYWDLAVLGGSGNFTPRSTVLSALTGPSNSTNYLAGTNNVNYNVNSNSNATPAFANFYFNTDRRTAYQVGETTGEGTLISAPAALDEGGNFIRPQFGPLSLETANSASFFGNYHLTSGVNGAALGSLYTTVPGALQTDFDQQARPLATPHRGADQVIAPVPATPVPQR